MGSPTIFSGRRTKLLTADGLLRSDGGINDNDGLKNYIANGHAEVNTTGWATFADAATSRPVDGIGGTANITWSRSTTTPLDGQADFRFVKDAVNRQGQGVSYDFTISSKDKAKVLTITKDYMVTSGTFVAGTSTTDGDLIAYIYNVGDSVLIEPSSFKFLSNSTTLSDKFQATFQTSSTSTTYRLILYCASTSASAYTLQFKNISVSPSTYVYGTPITDWRAYTPVFVGFGSPPVINVFSRRVGDTLEVSGYFQAGTVTATTASMTLGYGASGNVYTDTAKVGNLATIGFAGSNSTASATNFGYITVQSGTSNTVTFGIQTSTTVTTTAATGSGLIASSFYVDFQFAVPILGWSSSVQMSDQTDTRVVSGIFKTSTARTINNTSPTIVYETVTKDTHGAYNSTTGTYTVPVAGDYDVSAYLKVVSTATTVGHVTVLQAYVNGTSTASIAGVRAQVTTAINHEVGGSAKLPNLKVGDLVTFRIYADTANTLLSGDPNSNYVGISRISGPSAIASSESVNADYSSAAGQSIANNAETIIDFGTKAFDTHGTVTTGASWKFTAPIPGKYEISGYIVFASAAWTVNQINRLSLYKNGSLYRRLGAWQAGNTATYGPSPANGATQIQLIAGDYIHLAAYQNQGAAVALLASGDSVYVSIKRVGN